MGKVKKVLGQAWASPVTAVGLVYVLALWGLGWYRWVGVREDALVWQTGAMPGLMQRLWKGWGGHTLGSVVVMNCDPEQRPRTLQHELVHVRQCMRLGVLHPIAYGMCYLAIWAGCEDSSPYWSNPFEIDARRASGQIVDIEGTIRRLNEK